MIKIKKFFLKDEVPMQNIWKKNKREFGILFFVTFTPYCG